MPNTRSLASVYQLITEKTNGIQKSIVERIYDAIEDLNKTPEAQNEDILSIRDVIIKNLKEENEKLRIKVVNLEDKVERIEKDFIATTRNSFSNETEQH